MNPPNAMDIPPRFLGAVGGEIEILAEFPPRDRQHRELKSVPMEGYTGSFQNMSGPFVPPPPPPKEFPTLESVSKKQELIKTANKIAGLATAQVECHGFSNKDIVMGTMKDMTGDVKRLTDELVDQCQGQTKTADMRLRDVSLRLDRAKSHLQVAKEQAFDFKVKLEKQQIENEVLRRQHKRDQEEMEMRVVGLTRLFERAKDEMSEIRAELTRNYDVLVDQQFELIERRLTINDLRAELVEANERIERILQEEMLRRRAPNALNMLAAEIMAREHGGEEQMWEDSDGDEEMDDADLGRHEGGGNMPFQIFLCNHLAGSSAGSPILR